MDRSELGAHIAAHIDRNHPRLGSRLMKLRWGGLRTVQPDRRHWAGIGVLGTGLGVGLRRLLGRGGDGRPRVGLVASLGAGLASVWFGLWRVDSLRWHRSHVTLVLDLPNDRLEELLDRLAADGLHVERHDGPRRPGGAATGLSCRLRDLRRVNAALDALEVEAGQRTGSGGI